MKNPPLTNVTAIEVQTGNLISIFLRGNVAGAGSELRHDSDHTTAETANERLFALIWQYDVPPPPPITADPQRDPTCVFCDTGERHEH